MFHRKFKVYLITNLIDGMEYVGITVQSIKQRWSQHCNKFQPNRLYPAIQKYGKDNFKIEIIFQASSIDNMIDMENIFIKQYNTLHPHGYNLRDGGKYGKFTQYVKDEMTDLLKKRWKNTPEIYKNFLIARDNYIEAKKEPVIGININDKTVIKFDTILLAITSGYSIGQNLVRETKHANNYLWFYDEGLSDNFYIDLAEFQLGGFGTYKKNEKSWADPIHKESRVNSMIEAAKERAKPLIAVSRFNGSILKFPSINDAIKKGFTWGSVRQALIGECKHAYNYCWFYSKDGVNYVEEAKKILGGFDDTNIKSFIAISLETGVELSFKQLEDVKASGFDVKSVRQVLTGRRKTYKGYIWKFV